VGEEGNTIQISPLSQPFYAPTFNRLTRKWLLLLSLSPPQKKNTGGLPIER